MRSEGRRFVAVACVAALGSIATSDARAEDAGTKKDAGAVVQDAGTRNVGPIPEGAAMPPGHPMVPDDDADEDDDPQANPHAGGGAAHGANGMGQQQLPTDGAADDPEVPKGAIVAHIQDPDGKPIARSDVTLGVIHNSVAKGESRQRLFSTTNDQGVAKWDGLDTGTGVAYRVMVLKDGATFSAPPFQLSQKSGTSAILHVYPVETNVDKTLIVTQSMLYVEVKDDRIQIQQAFKIYNFGKNAWLPNDTFVPLPPEYTAFSSQQGMTDAGVDAIPQKGLKLHGTFPPGQQVIEFRWQLPYSGEADAKFEVGMTPHLAASRVIAPASRAMTLNVDGFPAPQSSTDGMGQRALVTERQLQRTDVLKSMKVEIHGLPTEGPGKIFATLIAAAGVALGLVLGTRKPPLREAKGERARLLEDLASLERAFAAGDVGPKTYERARRELLDEIARTFAAEAKTPKSTTESKSSAKS